MLIFRLPHEPSLAGAYEGLDSVLRARLGAAYDGWGSDAETVDYYIYGNDAPRLFAVVDAAIRGGQLGQLEKYEMTASWG